MASPHLLRPLVLFGPTACGKSHLALALARHLKPHTATHIVNADALQLYTHLPILTSQPTAADKKLTPHHLYAIAPPQERFSAGLYAEQARTLLRHLQHHHPSDAVIVCGGAGLYLKALLGGLTELPQPSPQARQQVQRWQKEGRNLYLLLQQRDPNTAQTLAPQDQHRIVRALEFFETCNASLLDARKGDQQPSPFAQTEQPLLIALSPPRTILYKTINTRFERMLKQGAIEEVRRFNAENATPPKNSLENPLENPLENFWDSPLRAALGLKEIEAYCKGEISWQTMVEQGQQRTRNYAKRQLTWMRHQLPHHATQQHTVSDSVVEDCDGVCRKVVQIWGEASCPRCDLV